MSNHGQRAYDEFLDAVTGGHATRASRAELEQLRAEVAELRRAVRALVMHAKRNDRDGFAECVKKAGRHG